MPEYVLNRRYILATKAGRVINFEKGIPVWVTPECEKEALIVGAQPVDGPKDILDPEAKVTVRLTAAERTAKIHSGFAILEARQERGDFTAQGVPSAKAIDLLVGVDVQTKERDEEWTAYKASKAEQ